MRRTRGPQATLAIVAIIPARFASTRLPGKPLSDIHGKPMIQHVWERACRARLVERVLVATEDERVAVAVRGFGGEVVLTSPRHATGTDRLAEAAGMCDADLVVNVQGDEPMLDPRWVDEAVTPLVEDRTQAMSTLSVPIRRVEDMLSPTVVKVVTDARGEALYFSRSPIPFVRLDPPRGLAEAAAAAVERGLARKHVGVYVYTRATLLRLAALPPSPLERAEGLEQLRALENGHRIKVTPVDYEPICVDTPEDIQKVEASLLSPR